MVELVINKKRKEVLEKQLEDIGVPFKFFEVQQEDGPSQTQWIEDPLIIKGFWFHAMMQFHIIGLKSRPITQFEE